MEQENAKRLLMNTPSSGDFFHFDHTLNLYRGCNHGCVYCDSRSECYHIERFDTVRVKKNALLLLRQELAQKRRAGVVMMGAASDPYNALEKELLVTRGALECLLRYGFGVGLSTKSALIARDKDVLSRFQTPVWVSFSVSTPDDELAALLEPRAALPSQRFSAMRELARAGVFTGVWLNPMLPFLSDGEEDVKNVARMTRENGGRYVISHFGVTLRTGDREYFYAALDNHPRFIGIKKKYIDSFGLDYICPSQNAERLYALLKEECTQAGLLYSYRQINEELEGRLPTQLSF